MQVLLHHGGVFTGVLPVDLPVHVLTVHDEKVHRVRCLGKITPGDKKTGLRRDLPLRRADLPELADEIGVKQRFTPAERDPAAGGAEVQMVCSDSLKKFFRRHLFCWCLAKQFLVDAPLAVQRAACPCSQSSDPFTICPHAVARYSKKRKCGSAHADFSFHFEGSAVSMDG